MATGLGCGLAPAAPGTVGSGAAVLAAVALERWAGLPAWALLALAAVLTPVAVWAAGAYASARGTEDPGQVVIDEVLGQWVALAAAPDLAWQWCLASFLLFRLFDIWKPFPVRRLERLGGGLGIVADDLGAGLYSAAVVCAWRLV